MPQQTLGVNPSHYSLENHGIRHPESVFWNLNSSALVEHAVQRHEANLMDNGALVAHTAPYTGRSPQDKFIVDEACSREHIDWGPVNRKFDPDKFAHLMHRMTAYFQGMELFVQDCWAGADPRYRMPIRVINTHAWHNLFARALLVRAARTETAQHVPQFTIIGAPNFHADPAVDGTRSEAFVIISFEKKVVLIGGTSYAGEIKKSVFTILNYLLPLKGILSMHCSANMGSSGDVALFFGLSGTGKTSLSADPARRLIGDDEHGWTDDGVFNFEGGCYAKCIHLSEEKEPQIYQAIRFGSVLENVMFSPDTRTPDYADSSLTENTRCAYPLLYIDNAVVPSVGGHPKNIIFLTCDAFGVLPPIAKLTADQAMFHFLSGYTAKVAGTEKGVTEPGATFSACFGAPFLPLPPSAYAKLLGERIARHGARCWLVNTGWIGGPYGVGRRIDIGSTRAMVSAALSGALDDVPTTPDATFGFGVPKSCPGVDTALLTPRTSWKQLDAYDAKAKDLAGRFVENFKRFGDAPAAVRNAGPKV